MTDKIKYTYLLLVALVSSLCACTDQLPSDIMGSESNDVIAFNINVEEQADIIYSYSKKRDAGSKDIPSIPDFESHELSGGIEGMNVHYMPLPMVGIHPKTVMAESDDIETRASLDDIVSSAINFHDSLTIWGFTDTRTLFDQILLVKINGWRSSVHWPYDGNLAHPTPSTGMKFYAVSPALEDMDIMLSNTPGYTTKPEFSYTVPDDIALQRDLVYGESEDIDVQDDGPANTDVVYGDATTEKEQHLGLDDKIVNLSFKHILTAVRFAQGKMPTGVKIKKIELYHIKNEGRYSAASNTWTDIPDDATATYDLDVEHLIDSWEATAENFYIDGGNVMFLMPHILTSQAQLNVTIEDAVGNIRVLTTGTGGMAGDVWNPGYTVTYKITISELSDTYYLLVEPSSDYETDDSKGGVPVHNETGSTTKYQSGSDTYEHSNANIDGSFIIHSFRNFKDYSANADGINHHYAVKWKVTGFSDAKDGTYTAENRPEWLASITGWENETGGKGHSFVVTPGNATGDNQTVNYRLGPQAYAIPQTRDHQLYLSANSVLESVDLSRYSLNGTSSPTSKPRTTANSYIVNAKGTYLIPTVYGNAIENGNVKSQSTSPKINPSNIFLDHRGNPITSAWVINQVNSDVSEKYYDGAGWTNPDRVGNPDGYMVERTVVEYNKSESDMKVEIVWADVANLFSCELTGNKTSAEGYRIQVGVEAHSGSETIQPANALVALKAKRSVTTTQTVYKKNESGEYEVYGTPTENSTTSDDWETLWTWHIWVTDEVLPNNGLIDNFHGLGEAVSKDMAYLSYNDETNSKIIQIKNASGSNVAKIMPVNLGWVPDDLEWHEYIPRDIWVEIAQTRSEEGTEPQTVHLMLHQDARPELIRGTGTVYQWGRPDAMPMTKYVRDSGLEEERKIYNQSDVRIDIGIADPSNDPLQFHSLTNFWDYTQYPGEMMVASTGENWWGANASLNNPALWSPTYKTLYDPCPPGYRVPTVDIFTFMSLTGVSSQTDELNMWEEDGTSRRYGQNNYGGYFYSQAHSSTIPTADRYKPMVYIPATGVWSGNNIDLTLMNTAHDNLSSGYYWTAQQASGVYRGQAVIVKPQKSNEGSLQIGVNYSYGDAMSIRPMLME